MVIVLGYNLGNFFKSWQDSCQYSSPARIIICAQPLKGKWLLRTFAA
jgi:hypothetical protein